MRGKGAVLLTEEKGLLCLLSSQYSVKTVPIHIPVPWHGRVDEFSASDVSVYFTGISFLFPGVRHKEMKSQKMTCTYTYS